MPEIDTLQQQIQVLQNELAALRLANVALENNMLAGAEYTERMLSEVEIQRNELREAHKTQQHLGNFIQRVVDTAGSLIIVLGPEGYVRMTNQRCRELLGLQAATGSTAIIDDFLPDDERQLLAQKVPALPWPTHSTLFELICHGGHYSGEHSVRTLDGTPHRYLINGAVLHNPQGKLEGAVINATDITELRRQEVELRRSEALLKEAQQYAHMGSWELDLRTKTLTWSDEAFRIFEINADTPTDTLVDTYRDFFAAIHPEDRQHVDQAFAESLRKRNPLDVVHRLLLPGERVKWVHQRGTHQFTPQGRPLRSVGTVQDITDRYLAEQGLRIAATAFESQEGMVITDTQGTILRVNKSFSNITGYRPDEVIGQTPRLLSSGRHDPAFYQAMWGTIHEKGQWHGEIWNRRKSGDVYPEWLTITAVKDDAGVVTHFVGTMTDITIRKTAEDEIRNLAFYDPLTKLPNRRLLLDRLQQALATSARTGKLGALLFIDLDNFKTLNDTLGHDMGDLLLQQVANRLLACVREGDTVARLGGDEFVVMLEDLTDNASEAANSAETVGEKILSALNQTYQLKDRLHHSSPSIGVTLFSDHQESIEELLKRADVAMYQSKAAGRNTLRFFDPETQAAVSARAALEVELRTAIVDQQFLLHYQPQLDGKGRVLGAEALVRWRHPERGMVSPAEFIPLAEESGLILPLGNWVLETACRQLALWSADPATAHLTLSVNVSARQLSLPHFVDEVMALINGTNAPADRLKLELTESLFLDNAEDIIAKMIELKEQHVGFSMDDFGTGYSSLSYLKRLPLDQLKIDQSFVRDVLTDANDAAIARTVIALGHSLGLDVIAEGVETDGQRQFLAIHGCLRYQGYLFSRPLPADEFALFHTKNRETAGELKRDKRHQVP